MTKVGFDYHCNICGGIVVADDDDFTDNENWFFDECEAEWRAENDEEARMENEIGGHIEDRKGGGICE